MKFLSFNKILYGTLAIAFLVGVIFIIWLFRPKSFIVTNSKPGESTAPLSSLTGLECDNPSKRPIAVMMSSDPEARPLSGIGEADLVFEMPVTPNGITRMMAVFQCGTPKEIGSVRSARQDFIPLAQGLKAIYAHWGGEHGALEELDNHIIDNVNALLYEGTTFYRKKGIRAPHNGFTTLQLIEARAKSLGYLSSPTSQISYPHTDKTAKPNISSLVDSVSVDWPLGMDVKFAFNAANNSYSRWRGGKPEIDALTRQQVSLGVVIVLDTTSSFLRDQYIKVKTIGEGTATIYQNGQKIPATWEKPTAQDMISFLDERGRQIPLAPGRIWILINAHLQ